MSSSIILPDLCVIIPASGKGTRYGEPKATALLETGESFLERIIAICKGADLNEIHPVCDRETPDMLSSLRLGISEQPGFAQYMVFPVDFPFVQSSTIRALLKKCSTDREAVIRPVYLGRNGHPIIIPASLDLSASVFEGGLAALIRNSGLQVTDLVVEDPGILRNVNYRF